MLRFLIKNPTSVGKSIAEEVPRQNVFSYNYLGILFAAAKMLKFEGCFGFNSGVKGQKMAQNDKKLCVLYSISQEAYIIHMMVISGTHV